MKSLTELPRNPLRDPGYYFRPVICVILGERGTEMLRHSTGVDAKALGRLLTVVCAKKREQIWRREEEK